MANWKKWWAISPSWVSMFGGSIDINILFFAFLLVLVDQAELTYSTCIQAISQNGCPFMSSNPHPMVTVLLLLFVLTFGRNLVFRRLPGVKVSSASKVPKNVPKALGIFGRLKPFSTRTRSGFLNKLLILLYLFIHPILHQKKISICWKLRKIWMVQQANITGKLRLYIILDVSTWSRIFQRKKNMFWTLQTHPTWSPSFLPAAFFTCLSHDLVIIGL